MPNYNITIDSRFDPYSFEDYLKPLATLQEQHNQAADAYATALANSAGLYDALRANAEDAEAAKYVNDYENSLNALANDLATNGLNRTNRRGVYETKAKTGYIEKLKKAIDNRNTFIAKQNELAVADPTRRFSDYAYNHGITRFLNPDFTYGSFSEAAIQKQVEDTVKYLAKSTYLRDPNNPQFKHIAGLTKLMQESTGARPEEIDAAMQAIISGQPLDEKQSKIAQMLYNDAMDIATQHLGNWNWDDDAKRAAYKAASKGLYSALGTEENKIFNVTEPKDSGSSKSGKGSVSGIQMRWNTMYFGDSAKDRTGTGALERYTANKNIKNWMPKIDEVLSKVEKRLPLTQAKSGQQGYNYHNLYDGTSSKEASEWIQDLFGLTGSYDRDAGNDPIDGIRDIISLANNMNLNDETLNDLNTLQNRILNSGEVTDYLNGAQTYGKTYSKYKPTDSDLKLVSDVLKEFKRRNDEVDAMSALSFELPLSKSDVMETFDNIRNHTASGFSERGLRRDAYTGIKQITGFKEDGTPVYKDGDGDPLLLKEAEKAVSSGNVNFHAIPLTVKDKNGKERTELKYMMVVDNKQYLVPDKYIPENLRPDNLRSVDDYIEIQRKYNKWSKNKDLNSLTEEELLQYSLFNNAIGNASSALGRSAAMSLVGPGWAFNKQHVNASDSQSAKFN